MTRTGWLPIKVVLGTLLLSPSSLADASACAAIADRSARLQCFTAVRGITASVSRVLDGDTLDICIGTSCIRVRLCGIDAPEPDAPGGRAATEALREMVSRKTIRCVPVGQGTVFDGRSRAMNQGRLVAQCFLGDAGTVNATEASGADLAMVSRWMR